MKCASPSYAVRIFLYFFCLVVFSDIAFGQVKEWGAGKGDRYLTNPFGLAGVPWRDFYSDVIAGDKSPGNWLRDNRTEDVPPDTDIPRPRPTKFQNPNIPFDPCGVPCKASEECVIGVCLRKKDRN